MPKHLVHAHSVVVTEGNPKLPAASRIEYGEIAVNYAEGHETLSIKNSNDDIVTFSSDDAIKKIIIDNEKVVANSLNDINGRITQLDENVTEMSGDVDDKIEELSSDVDDKIEELSGDVDDRFEEMQTLIDDDEQIVANALTDLDQRLKILEQLLSV